MLSSDRENFFLQYTEKKTEFDKRSCIHCFHHYDTDSDGYLSQSEFEELLCDLFTDSGQPNHVSPADISKFIELLDVDKDGKLSKKDFTSNSYYWLKQILQPVSALVIIDVQNDFLDGSLALKNCAAGQDGNGVIPSINTLLDQGLFDVVIYSRDWHPQDHISFIDNVNKWPLQSNSNQSQNPPKLFDTVTFEGPPKTEQKLWPSHCVQNSWGAQIHPDLKFIDGGIVLDKGTKSNVDSYSAFWDNNKLSQTDLVKTLAKHKVTDVYLCGVAYDICVGYTGLDALDHGFRTVLIEDACRGVDLDDIEKMKKALQEKGAIIVHSSKVNDLIRGSNRRVELGLQTANNVAVARKMVKEGIVS